jgi:nucleoside-diphosphate-sugar epimerase
LAGNVLVTGGTGFIGSALVNRLTRSGHKVIALGSRDGTIETVDISEKLQGNKVDHVVHLAGKTYVPDSWNKPEDFYRVNVQGTANVANYCRANGATLTYVSAYVYGTPSALPIREDSVIAPHNPYAQSKFLGEMVCQQFAQSFGLPVTILRPFNTYGIGQSAYFLIPKIIDQVLHAERIELDSLTPKRDYIYIDDLVDAIAVSLGKTQSGSIYNLGSEVSISVENVVRIVQVAAGTDKPVVSRDIHRENEVMDVVADISRFCADFAWQPKFGFADGIAAILRSHSGKL